MEEYKGIKRGQSREMFYWLDTYCKDQRPQILENDLVLQRMVRNHYLKKRAYVIIVNVTIWAGLIYTAYILFKG